MAMNIMQLRKKVLIRGIVQGIGFRPTVWRLAQEMGLTGWIANNETGALIEVQGASDQLNFFLNKLTEAPPPLAVISKLDVSDMECLVGESNFEIRQTEIGPNRSATVPPDLAFCSDCERELLDCTNRRYQYPFINCTRCGPRYTILKALPYDRFQTTMEPFEMCPSCRREYENPEDRRFHAQPNACHCCGPQVWFVMQERLKSVSNIGERCETLRELGLAMGSVAIKEARSCFHSGFILAIKGIGGFHLACDAQNEGAVQLLRSRKQRPTKPLAVMVADLDTARQISNFGDLEANLLLSSQRPIVLLPKRSGGILPEGVAPNNPQIGIMLAYSPLHRLLIQPGEVWVMTSGNLAEEPICQSNDEARQRLSRLCDAFLFHDRRIVTVCDDSVVRSDGCQTIPLRRSRGFCPLPIPVPGFTDQMKTSCVLALGGELKSTVCLTVRGQAIMGQHIGDMSNQETLEALERSVDHLINLYSVRPQMIIADAHPGYLSAEWGSRRAARWQIPFHRLQHHHAHAISVGTENGLSGQSLIAVVFDGTGYGTDGKIWGGEWLIANQLSFERFAQLAYTPLPGGDSCIERPAKTALAQLFHYSIPWNQSLPSVENFSETEINLLERQLRNDIHCVPSSSMGRLFDAVASLIGLQHRISYEAEAAIGLEFLAAEGMQLLSGSSGSYAVDLVRKSHWIWDTRSLITAVVNDCLSNTDKKIIAAKFHRTISIGTRQICEMAREATGINQVGLTGGVFQNLLLTEMVSNELQSVGFAVLKHSLVPPNDAGLSLGQASYGHAFLQSSQHKVTVNGLGS
jgi:hydrogenase maturation protein HypF